MPSKHQNVIFLRKEWKQIDTRDSTAPTARPCEIPPGPSQETMAISADSHTKDNNVTYSHCVPVILALHTISFIKVSVPLYRQDKLIVILEVSDSTFHCVMWIPGWKRKCNESKYIPKCSSHIALVTFTLFAGKGRKEGKNRKNGKGFGFLLIPFIRADFIILKTEW